MRPTAKSPSTWRIDYTTAAEVANTRWREQFGDAVLSDLVDSALN